MAEQVTLMTGLEMGDAAVLKAIHTFHIDRLAWFSGQHHTNDAQQVFSWVSNNL